MKVFSGSRFPLFTFRASLLSLVDKIDWFGRTAAFFTLTVQATFVTMKVVKSCGVELLAPGAAF